MGIDELLKLADAISKGTVTFLVACLGLIVYLLRKQQKLEQELSELNDEYTKALKEANAERVRDLNLAFDRIEKQNSAYAAAVEVIQTLNSKLGRRP